jgi:hypothetical protein
VSRKDRDERRSVRTELRQLAKEERKRQEKAVEEVLAGAQVGGRVGWVLRCAALCCGLAVCSKGGPPSSSLAAGDSCQRAPASREITPAAACLVHHHLRQVICATLTGVGNRQLERLSFDVVVIDEAAQVPVVRCAVLCCAV